MWKLRFWLHLTPSPKDPKERMFAECCEEISTKDFVIQDPSIWLFIPWDDILILAKDQGETGVCLLHKFTPNSTASSRMLDCLLDLFWDILGAVWMGKSTHFKALFAAFLGYTDFDFMKNIHLTKYRKTRRPKIHSKYLYNVQMGFCHIFSLLTSI